jgi:hypothetical protein
MSPFFLEKICCFSYAKRNEENMQEFLQPTKQKKGLGYILHTL